MNYPFKPCITKHFNIKICLGYQTPHTGSHFVISDLNVSKLEFLALSIEWNTALLFMKSGNSKMDHFCFEQKGFVANNNLCPFSHRLVYMGLHILKETSLQTPWPYIHLKGPVRK